MYSCSCRLAIKWLILWHRSTYVLKDCKLNGVMQLEACHMVILTLSWPWGLNKPWLVSPSMYILHIYEHLHWMIVVNIILNHIKTLFMWCVLANCVTISVRTSGTVSCQPLPFVSSAHWSGRSCSGDDIDLQPPNHQSPYLCSRREGCVYTCTSWQTLYEVCSWVPRLVNCSVHAHTWVSVTCLCSYMSLCYACTHVHECMHAHTHNGYTIESSLLLLLLLETVTTSTTHINGQILCTFKQQTKHPNGQLLVNNVLHNVIQSSAELQQ